MHYQYILLLTLLWTTYENVINQKNEKDIWFNNDYLPFNDKFNAFDKKFLAEKIVTFAPEGIQNTFFTEIKKWFGDPAKKTKLLALLCEVAHRRFERDKNTLQEENLEVGKNILIMLSLSHNIKKTNEILEFEKDFTFIEYFRSCFRSDTRPTSIQIWLDKHNEITAENLQENTDFWGGGYWFDNFCGNSSVTRKKLFQELIYQLIYDAILLPDEKKRPTIPEDKLEFLYWRYFFLLRITFMYFFNTIDKTPKVKFAMIDFEFEHYFMNVTNSTYGNPINKRRADELQTNFFYICGNFLMTCENFQIDCQNGGKDEMLEFGKKIQSLGFRSAFDRGRFAEHITTTMKCKYQQDESIPELETIKLEDIPSEEYRDHVRTTQQLDSNYFINLFNQEKPDLNALKIIFYYTVFKGYQTRYQFARHDEIKFISETGIEPEIDSEIEVSIENRKPTPGNEGKSPLEPFSPEEPEENQQEPLSEYVPEASTLTKEEENSTPGSKEQNNAKPELSQPTNLAQEKSWFKKHRAKLWIFLPIVLFYYFFNFQSTNNFFKNLLKSEFLATTPEPQNAFSMSSPVMVVIVIIILIIGLSYYVWRLKLFAFGNENSGELAKELKNNGKNNAKNTGGNKLALQQNFTSAFCSTVAPNAPKRLPYKSISAGYGESKF